MPLKLAEFHRLIAMMSRTASDNDHEALASVRAANKILTSNALTWEMVLKRVVSVVNEVEDGTAYGSGEIRRHSVVTEGTVKKTINPPPGVPRPPPPRTQAPPPSDDEDDDMDQLFDDALAGAAGDFRETLMSMRAQWERQRWLSGRQRQVVADAAERYAERYRGGRVR